MVVHLQVQSGFTIQYNLQSPLNYGHKSITNIQEFYAGCEENATKTESQNQLPAHSFTENNKLHSLPLTTTINSLHCKPFVFTCRIELLTRVACLDFHTYNFYT